MGEWVFATVDGQPLTELPKDLFIPPHALEVLLDRFSGPLDLLLYLIRKQHFDILNIPVALITMQYMEYIALMKERSIELAVDYLVMAALLAEIKSRLLLPQHAIAGEDEAEDPRLELVKRLQAYEQFKLAASWLDQMPRLNRDHFPVYVVPTLLNHEKPLPDVTLGALVLAMNALLNNASHYTHHQISREPLSVRERMVWILECLQSIEETTFSEFLQAKEGRRGVVVTLLALLELAKQSLIVIHQHDVLSAITIQGASHGK